MSAATDVSTTDASAQPRRPRRKVVLTWVLVGALVLAALFTWRWWTHPTAFDDLGDSGRLDPLPVADAALSTTVIYPKASGSAETVTIDGLDATFSENSAAATATFWVCHLAPDEDPIGAVHDPSSVCGDIESFEPPMRFEHGVAPDSDYLFVTITPSRPGVARLQSVDIEYRRSGEHFYQRGTQTIHVDRKLTAR
ncbi:hypothetical protein [Nocardioides sp. Arc9.136]|uniref:hypothetical protein n=1 Tax=Nocardioides sp. Arc9.136 TaxID=2996826 RepID=UPI002666EB44|nr:hypothetical protein [Nocardioides sp. Arc9.136]WKN47407.1 hypothetical protein OSR43_15370 [Nocardioides sp. Arc9.136]